MLVSPPASTSHSNSAQPMPTHQPSSYSTSRYGQSDPLATKRRKVAPAQPPRVYAGFSSTDVTQGAEYRHHHTRSKDLPSVSGVKVHQYSSKYTSSNPAKVRKVHRLVSEGGKDTDAIITPSSWRVGRELAERILKAQQRAEELLSDSTLDHSSSTSRVSLRDSLELSSHASTPSHSLSDTGLHSGVLPGASEKPAVLSPDHWGAAEDSDEGSEVVSSQDSILEGPPRATQVSSDMDRLLEELRASSREGEAGIGGEEEHEGLATGFREKSAAATAGRSLAAKTKYSYGELMGGRLFLCPIHSLIHCGP